MNYVIGIDPCEFIQIRVKINQENTFEKIGARGPFLFFELNIGFLLIPDFIPNLP
jgi:hypothetical protein